MSEPNFKVGWVIPNKIAVLTHFHSAITPEDIQGVMTESGRLLQGADDEFHLIIDNRVAPLPKIYSLEQLQDSSPILSHPLLKYLVVVKPMHLILPEIEEESKNGVTLKNVASVQEAFQFLSERTSIELTGDEMEFFPILTD